MSDAELRVINSVLKTGSLSAVLSADTDDFFFAYGDVWKEIQDYYKNYKAVPSVGVIQDKFPDFQKVEVEGEPAYHLNALRTEFLETRVEDMLVKAAKAMDAKKRSPQEILDRLTMEVGKLSRYSSGVRDMSVTDTEDALRHYSNVRERVMMMGGSPGISTGFKSIDSAYATGMAPGHMIVVIGWPGKMKTWFTTMLAINAFMEGFKPMLISLEMDPETMRNRIYTMMGQGMFPNSDLNRGDVNVDDFKSFTKRNFADKQDIIIIAPEGVGEVTPNVIQGKIDQHKPDLVICDYHQLFSDNSKNSNPTQRGMALSREFKLLATRNQIPLIDITAATQSDVSDRERPPIMAQVAWSKSIEYDADLAFSVHKHDESGLVEVSGLKNRHGDLFNFMLDWDVNNGIITEKFGD